MSKESSDGKNKLYFGDNLPIMRTHIPDESVDLIYLDPPFNSQATYNVLFSEKDGTNSSAQITAFEDTWHWGPEAESTYAEAVERPNKMSDLLVALRRFLGENDMMAYLVMMAARLGEIHRVLKPTGSVYLHCDSTASHYLKLLLDSVFGFQQYRAEIIWKRYSSHGNVYKNYGKIHDVILFYTKTADVTWNQPSQPLNKDYIDSFFRHVEPDTGRRYRLQNVLNPNKNRPNLTYEWNGHLRVWKWTRDKMQEYHDQGRLHYSSSGYPSLKQYLDESVSQKAADIWLDIKPLTHSGKERLGYPTQKPEALLERIITASSNEGDLVLDPFCGCGTTVAVAERLKRRWIGIDITYLAISLMKTRLQDTFKGELSPYEIIGDPKDFSGAKALAEQNRFQFEWWVVGKVGAYPAKDKRKGADSGVDGVINFFDDNTKIPKRIVVQVKSGKVQVSHIRDLIGVVKREQAVIGVFMTLNQPTEPMKIEAVKEGYYVSELLGNDRKFTKIQIITIEELLGGASIDYPRMADATFKKAQRKFKKSDKQSTIIK